MIKPDPYTQTETTVKIFANILHDLSPDTSVKEWEKHIRDTAHDPKKFFNGNGEGLNQYNAFVSNFDADKKAKLDKLNKSKAKKGDIRNV